MKYLHENLSIYNNIYTRTTRTPHHHLPSSIVEHSAQFYNSTTDRVSNTKRDGCLSVLRATTVWTANSSQNKTHFAYCFLVVREPLCEVVKEEVHRRRPRTDLRIIQSDRAIRTSKSDRPIRSLRQDQQVGSSNHLALAGPTSRIVQSDRSGRTNKSDPPIRSLRQDQQVVRTNQIYPTDLLFVRTNQIFPTDLLSVRKVGP